VLHITIPDREFFDEEKQEFVRGKGMALDLEHSLVSLSKWESKWLKPFLGNDERTNEQTIDYIRCMTVGKGVPDDAYQWLPDGIFNQITEYIAAPMTATWFNERDNPRKSREVVTAEIIYYWMIAHNIPMECQKWHLNRLLTLIRVCNLKNQPSKKMGKKEMLSRRRALNEARRSKFNSRG
jgi:hypothetical protein